MGTGCTIKFKYYYYYNLADFRQLVSISPLTVRLGYIRVILDRPYTRVTLRGNHDVSIFQ